MLKNIRILVHTTAGEFETFEMKSLLMFLLLSRNEMCISIDQLKSIPFLFLIDIRSTT